MRKEIRYIELKSCYSDNGPAWIANVLYSKSGKTIYFHDMAFQRCAGIKGNYRDIESGNEYWISGVKKDGSDRHWCGGGIVTVDSKVLVEYLAITGQSVLSPSQYQLEDIPEDYPVERIRKLTNSKE